MPLLADVLARFRRTWAPTPGVGAGPGVPEDRPALVAQEVSVLFQDLDAMAAEAASIREQAERERERIVESARQEAARIAAAATDRVPQVRARTAAARLREIHRAGAAELEQAEQRAAAIRKAAAERMPGIERRILDAVFAGVAEGEARGAGVVGGR